MWCSGRRRIDSAVTEDTAGLFKRLTFTGVNTVTLPEGDIIPLVGLKGTINALLEVEVALDSGEAAT
jgi:hypothetical protein